jgi:thiol-disulfide isomerase/thioredoxin
VAIIIFSLLPNAEAVKSASTTNEKDVLTEEVASESDECKPYTPLTGRPKDYERAFNDMQDKQKAAAEKAIARCKEIVASLSFQPVVFAEGEFTEIPEGAILFSTQDLNGNVVTNELFLGKKLTVFNIWGTFCTPCINEMPELAEWSQNMPEGVQLVGLVSDLNSYDDAEILEMAQMICEATDADVYTSLVANEDFTEMLSGVVGVPTTFFIDGNGVIVGDPVVGANVAACKEFVESYLAQ